MIGLDERIRNLRKERGMTQDDLAEALGVSRQTVYKWETGRTLPDVNRLKQLCELFHVSSDALLAISPTVDDKTETISEDTQERSHGEATTSKQRKKHATWLYVCAGVVLLCVVLAMLFIRQPEELRQAQELGIVPSELLRDRSQSTSEQELLTLLSNVCKEEAGKVPDALAACAAAATNERLTREKAAYWLYCAHIWTKIDQNASLSLETDPPQISQRNVYEDLNTLSRSAADSMGTSWEQGLCRELAEADSLFARYDGTAEMDEQINAILFGPYYTSVTFCLAQKSFLNEKSLMDCDGDSFRPKEKITREEAIIAAYRLYGSW